MLGYFLVYVEVWPSMCLECKMCLDEITKIATGYSLLIRTKGYVFPVDEILLLEL